MSKLTVDNIDRIIERAQKEYVWFNEKLICRETVSNPEKEPKELYLAKLYLERGHDVDWHTHGLIINDKFIIGYNSGKWRVKGKSKWYWYSEKRFIEILER